MKDFGVAVKAFIIRDGKLLILKRVKDEAHYADKWDIPGGRLLPGEDPFEGLKRETKEETGLDVEILLPFAVNHFVRDDGQKITMIIFLCKPLTDSIVLSDEHVDYRWFDLKTLAGLQDWLVPIAKDFFKYGLENFAS